LAFDELFPNKGNGVSEHPAGPYAGIGNLKTNTRQARGDHVGQLKEDISPSWMTIMVSFSDIF